MQQNHAERPKKTLENKLAKITQATGQFLDWLIPAQCLACERRVHNNSYPYCNRCVTNLPYHDYACLRCGQAFAALQDYCGRCLLHPPAYDSCFCPFTYNQPIDRHICDFKYSKQPQMAAALAQLLAAELRANNIPMPQLLLPVPIHPSRLRQRGFNQSWLLTRRLARLLRIPCSNHTLQKCKVTPAQAQLPLRARIDNNKGSFCISKGPLPDHVAIVDDVVTTGSTAEEIAKILKRNGVDYVQIWGIAHSI